MSNIWLVSYILLWVFVIGLALLIIGVLQQIGLLHRQLAQLGTAAASPPNLPVPAPRDDGPPLGAILPELALETINGFGTLRLPPSHNGNGTLLVVLSPMCETCQRTAEPLNKIVDDGIFHGTVAVLMKSDEQACRAFLSLFPLHLPVVCDRTREIIMGFQVHNIPFGLLYDSQGILKAKGMVRDCDDLLTLLRDALVSLPE